MEKGDDMTPFWLQPSDNRRRPSSFFLNTGILIILLLVVALAFVFFIVPSFLSLTSKIFKPQLVKKSWDSLNLVLVLFAIICGFLCNAGSKSNDDDNTPKQVPAGSNSNPSSSTPDQWYEYDHHSSSSDRSRTAYNASQRLKSSSSYPDLRRETSSMMNGDDRWRFYDDTRLYKYYPSGRSRRQNDEERVYANDTKDIAVDTGRTSQPPPHSPPPQLPRVVRTKPKRTNYEDAKAKERGERKEVILSEMKIKHPRSPPSQSPPPPPLPPTGRQEKRSSKGEKKTGGGTKEFLVSLRRKKKKERQRSVENLEEFFRLSTLPLHTPPSPPPPPPAPPPLPPFYQSIFHSKKSKGRKHHSIPPSPPSSLVVKPQKPPLSVKINNTNNVEESMESGNESPINPIPPPPPPPPFKLRPWKFEVQGDFVRLKSNNISRSDSPDSDDTISGEASPSDGNKMGEMAGALFCASPDVNTKADNFIARFRAGLTLEKINSVRGRSNLGPDPGPTTV